MTPHFSRHEQFLRIFALLDILANSRQPLDDRTLIGMLKERLGLSRLSARTLHRDCMFLASCGYPVDHSPLPATRRYGWRLDRDALAGRAVPAEPLTVLEFVAFLVARDLLRTLEGTVLWTGIESLRHKLERNIPSALLEQCATVATVFQVVGLDGSRYAMRPRLISSLTTAITDRREITLALREADGRPTSLRLCPLRLVIEPPRVRLLGGDAPHGNEPYRLVDIADIDQVSLLDTTFTAPLVDLEEVLNRLLT